MLWVCLSLANTKELFFRIKRKGIELSTGKDLKETLVKSAVQQKLGDKSTFQQGRVTVLTLISLKIYGKT